MSAISKKIRTQKCESIIAKIVELANQGKRVGFVEDWGGNSLTIEVGTAHTHVGMDDMPWEKFVDALHGCLCEGRGMSWFDPESATPATKKIGASDE